MERGILWKESIRAFVVGGGLAALTFAARLVELGKKDIEYTLLPMELHHSLLPLILFLRAIPLASPGRIHRI